MLLFKLWGDLTFWIWLSCSRICLLLHCTHRILPGTSCSLSLLPLAEFILTALCYWLCCFLCLQKLSHLLCLEKPYSSPLRPRSEASSLHSLAWHAPYLLSLTYRSRFKSFQPLCSYNSFFYKSIRALITLYWGMTCKILTNYTSTRPISMFFFEFPATSTVPGTVGL